MKKYLYKVLYPFAKIYWYIFKPTTNGVRIIIENNKKILLVRHTYIPGNNWMLPGGGVNKFECFDEAIKRELKEEMNIEIENIYLHGIYQLFEEGKNDSIILFTTTDSVDAKKIIIDEREIMEYRFHHLDNLPKNIADGHLRRIKEYISKKTNQIGKW